MDWKDYQEQAASFFRELGCSAQVDHQVEGARGRHKIDVWVKFNRFGFECKWAIECKYWNSNVPKEKALAFKSLVEDVGADRGIMITEIGFQKGAYDVTQNTNIELITFENLGKIAEKDLLVQMLENLETRVTELNEGFHSLWITEKKGPGHWNSKLPAGADSDAVLKAGGSLSVIEYGFQKIRLGKSKLPIRFDESEDKVFSVKSVKEFVLEVGKQVEQFEKLYKEQKAICESKK
jgi:hypothetical protein